MLGFECKGSCFCLLSTVNPLVLKYMKEITYGEAGECVRSFDGDLLQQCMGSVEGAGEGGFEDFRL